MCNIIYKLTKQFSNTPRFTTPRKKLNTPARVGDSRERKRDNTSLFICLLYPAMTSKKRKKPPDCSFAFISLFSSAFPSRLSSHSICLLTSPSLEVLDWALNCFRSAQIVGLFANDKLGQAAMVSSLQHATLTRSALGHYSWMCWAFDYQIYGFSVIMVFGEPAVLFMGIFWTCRSYRSATNFIS